MKEKFSKKLVLLDAHAIIHRAYHALPDFVSSKGEPTGALYGLAIMLLKIIADLKPDYIVACYDLPKPTYRHEAFVGYKAGRKKTDDELISQLKRSNDIFKSFSIPAYSKEGFEADDILGTIVEKTKGDKNLQIVIASGDMDTLQLVFGQKVEVYTLKKGINDTIIYDENAVIARFGFKPELIPDYKGLRGDPSDNIPGIKGIGEKTASSIIQKFGSVESFYKEIAKNPSVLEKAGVKPKAAELLRGGEEEALFSKMLATIRRDAPIDFSLPERHWKDNFDIKKVQEVFAELEFRTLIERVKRLVGLEEGVVKKTPELEVVRQVEPVDEEKLAKTAIALWLLDSNKTTPGLSEILAFTKTTSLDEASKVVFANLAKTPMQKVFDEIENPLIPVLAQAKARGVMIDTKYLKKLGGEYHAVVSEIEKKVWKLAGEEFNISSPKQLGVVIFTKLGLKAKNQKKTGTGALSTKESELEKLRDAHPIISLVLEYRELSKLLGTYIDTIPNMLHEDGRLHASLLQAGTTTGRLSSEDPNVQNIPNKTDLGRKIRRGFTATPGFKLVAFDYSQIELRIAAFLSHDKRLIEIFKAGEDVHTAVAAAVFGVPLAEVTYDMRRKAKVINFGVMYGMGVNALRANLGTDRPAAQKFYNDYFKNFSGLALYLDEVKASAHRLGFTETFFGRRRYFSGLTSKLPFIRASAERMAINAPIQGTEADIIKLAMVNVDNFLKKEGFSNKVFLLLQVHDELVYEIESGLVEKVAPRIKEIMQTSVSPEKTSGIVCTAEVSVGDNWEEMKKITTQ